MSHDKTCTNEIYKMLNRQHAYDSIYTYQVVAPFCIRKLNKIKVIPHGHCS